MNIREEKVPDFKGYMLLPEHVEKAAGMILLHAYNQTPEDVRFYAEKIAEKGIVVFAPKYTDASDGVIVAVNAIRKLKNASNIDEDRIGLFGISLGGTMALLTSTQEEVAFVIDGAGWVDLAELYRFLSKYPPNTPQKIIVDTIESALDTPEENPEMYRLSSPINYVDQMTGKILIVHGDKDNMVPLEQSKILYEKLKGLGKTVELKVIEGAGYLFKGYENRVVEAIIEFLYKYRLL